MVIQENNNIEGEEYKLFKNLLVGLNNKILTLLPIEHDSSLLYKNPKAKYFINDEYELKERVNEEVDKIIKFQIIPKRSNFFLHRLHGI